MSHVCPWWGGYFIDNRCRRLIHKPEAILVPYVQPGMAMLDFGCGMGFFAIPMSRLVGEKGRVIAADLQQKMLDVLNKRARKAGVGDRIETHRCQTNSLGVTGSVGFALAFYSLHEVPDAQSVIREIHGLIRPAGKFLIVEPIRHVNAAGFENLLSLSQEMGFTVTERPRIKLSRAALLLK
jgi:ubiquinone/menaquinone biosynthesis C-methylase UbiE